MRRVIDVVLCLTIVLGQQVDGLALEEEESGTEFTPRESIYAPKKTRRLEWPKSMALHTTEVPLELIPPYPGPKENLCDVCRGCQVCRLHEDRSMLPLRLMNDTDKIVLNSIPFGNVKGAIEIYLKYYLADDLWRLGLSPFRAHVMSTPCAVVISMFRGAFPACNCDPPPDPYQFYLEDVFQLFNNTVDLGTCTKDVFLPGMASCSISVKPDVMASYYLFIDDPDYFPELAVVNKTDRYYMQTPSFKLTVTLETIYNQFENYKETFLAISRRELLTVVRDITEHHKKGHKQFSDIQNFFEYKINGTEKFCIKVGFKEQEFHTFDEFMKMDKTK